MITTKELNEIINKIAPYELAEGWDNCGLLLDCGLPIDKILFALDATGSSLARAKELGCGAVVTHHPAIFGGIKVLCAEDPVVIAAMSHISLLAAHTCFDAAEGGVNDALCSKLGIEEPTPMLPFGRCGVLAAGDAAELAEKVKKSLGCESVAYVDGGRPIDRVAVVGGAAGELISQAAWLGCDAFITGELKHHEALFAQQIGMTVISAGHFITEIVAIKTLCERVQSEIAERAGCLIYSEEQNPIKYL
ncbi:MAG: Nif3-like dinuclear metal center hexameric protein [Oscillospiraceae bacterium]